MHFDFSYTAIFSPRKNTPAARMEDLPMKLKKERFHAFDAVIKKTSWQKRESAVGKTLEVLVEKSEINDEGLYVNSGRSREFFEVFFESGRMLKGKEVDVDIIERKGYVLSGKLEEGIEPKPKKVVQGLRMVR
jgi:tRNA-2-methylthio-N6-dimethylallyladenosine synthase